MSSSAAGENPGQVNTPELWCGSGARTATANGWPGLQGSTGTSTRVGKPPFVIPQSEEPAV